MPLKLFRWPTGNIYKEYIAGPRTEPWGTPNMEWADEDMQLLIGILKYLSDKYESHLSKVNKIFFSKHLWTVHP